jgi:hypothetical protein
MVARDSSGVRMTRGLEWFCSFVLAACAGFVLTTNIFVENTHQLRVGAALAVLIFLQFLQYPRFWVFREFSLYLAFVGYMILSLLWTDNVDLALPTLSMTLNFVLVLILFGALVLDGDLRVVLAGILAGLLAGAAVFTLTTGFPFVYPQGLSYNSVAGMYLFALIVTVLFGWHTRFRVLPILLGLVLLLHIAATTSIKTNLGVLVAIAAGTLMYFRGSIRMLLRNAIPIALFVAVVAYAVISDAALVERVQAGIDRVSFGASVLLSHDDATDSTGLGTRQNWKNEGLRGWAENPLFGHGVEAFRADYENTSHSTPIDLLYNSGLIGLFLFYAIFASLTWRWFRARQVSMGSLRALILGALGCYAFMSISGIVYYDGFLPAFIALGAGILRRHVKERSQARIASMAWRS